MTGAEIILRERIQNSSLQFEECPDIKETSESRKIGDSSVIQFPDISFMERTSRTALLENFFESKNPIDSAESLCSMDKRANKIEKWTPEERGKIIEETHWSNEITDKIDNLKQYEILENAELVEKEVNGRVCLIKENIDFDYTDEDGISNRDRMLRGLAPIDSKTGKPIELHHLGQKADSPLVELTEEEHRTGEYEEGKKNQSLWHDNQKETEVHGQGNNWDYERKSHWKARALSEKGEGR